MAGVNKGCFTKQEEEDSIRCDEVCDYLNLIIKSSSWINFLILLCDTEPC